MKRPLLVWLVFAACAFTGLAVLGWFSREMVRLDRDAARAREIAAREENVRLALWRMDSALASVHGLEASRPTSEYAAFVRAPTSFTVDLRENTRGAILIPSPLLGFTPPFVRLHVQLHHDGTLTSPQVPEDAAHAAAEEARVDPVSLEACAGRLAALRQSGLPERLMAELAPAAQTKAEATLAASDEPVPAAETKLAASALVHEFSATPAGTDKQGPAAPAAPQITPQLERQATVELRKSQAEQQQRAVLADENYFTMNRASQPRARSGEASAPAELAAASVTDDAGNAAEARDSATSSGARDRAETTVAGTPEPAPASTYGTSSSRATAAPSQAGPRRSSSVAGVAPPRRQHEGEREPPGRAATFADGAIQAAAGPTVSAGPLQVLWVGGDLFFVREIDGSPEVRAQAVWLDWAELRAWLLGRVTDLLPQAELEPAPAHAPFTLDDASRRLAFLPVRLRPGAVPVPDAPGWSPLHSSLALAWSLAGVGVLALALLLAGTLRLSERRGAFVSAVTHELRTPLTTFRMYTEMLAGGMVPDPAKRDSYLNTLRRESERLSHLVENVLSYARLERGRASRRVEDTTAGEVLHRMEERLRLRAEQGGLALRSEFDGTAADAPLRTDTTALEQIVFNLVDNAAKYGRRPGVPGTLVIAVSRSDRGRTVLRVIDDGPGIAPAVRKRLFQPFSKSATEAAHSQPGVGLGLALSRRLARDELKGELSLERTGPEGTVFRLEV